MVIYDIHDRVVSINDAFVSTFGFTSNEVIGLNVTELPIIPEERTFEANLSRSYAILGEKIKGYETIRKTKDNRTLSIILSSFPLLNEDSTPNGWAVIYKDITDKKEAQELLIKSEKLSIAGELAAGIAHEIRNPITTIKGFLQLLQATGNEKQTYYDIMKSEIDRIELILSELLMLAKPQAVHFAP
ncbi:histidine kinase dimerization/phospho-acceptor domain-containing protein [Metabacillus halosaccharovorans]|uniref:histidine kinase dimerization/phospho-acceptor domain-containing protein n=1 Tax=Metabacillus halosaccharovorans TaxID=930124 RepID=UPI003183ABEF